MGDEGIFRLLALPGSVRRASVSKAILRTLRETAPAHVAIEIFELDDIPIYNQDFDHDPPAPVRALREAIKAADGLIVLSPEYNHGMSGVIKNAIDWVSRPGYASILSNKAVAVFTTSESPLGGARAQADLHKMFLSTLSRVAPGHEVSFGSTGKNVVDGKLVDAALLKRAWALIESLLAEIRLTQGE
jgi:chromate reductase, NAD(P)H dehydrogenase (quinone)